MKRVSLEWSAFNGELGFVDRVMMSQKGVSRGGRARRGLQRVEKKLKWGIMAGRGRGQKQVKKGLCGNFFEIVTTGIEC